MDRQKIIKRIGLLLAAVVIIGIGYVLFLNTQKGSVSITAENNADIFIATEQDGEFKKIGAGEAIYKSRDFSKPVYIQATDGSKKTISGVWLKKGEDLSINLAFSNPLTANVLSEGSVFNPYIEGNLVQGIIPDEYTMTSFRTDRFETTRPELSSLPFMKKVVWSDKNNFVYTSLRRGVGQFVNGKDLGSDSGFASSMTGVSLPNVTRRDGQTKPLITITDAAKAPGKPLVLISESNIFTSPDLGTNLTSIIGFKKMDDVTNEVFATNDYILRYGAEMPATSADESNKKNSGAAEDTKLVEVYDYTGKKLRDLEVRGESILNVAQINKDILLLSGDELTHSNDDQVTPIPLYFKYVGDIASNQRAAFVLAGNAVWQVSTDGKSLQQIYSFESGVGLEKSMIVQDSQIIFGTRPKPTDTNVIGKLLSIQF